MDCAWWRDPCKSRNAWHFAFYDLIKNTLLRFIPGVTADSYSTGKNGPQNLISGEQPLTILLLSNLSLCSAPSEAAWRIIEQYWAVYVLNPALGWDITVSVYLSPPRSLLNLTSPLHRPLWAAGNLIRQPVSGHVTSLAAFLTLWDGSVWNNSTTLWVASKDKLSSASPYDEGHYTALPDTMVQHLWVLQDCITHDELLSLIISFLCITMRRASTLQCTRDRGVHSEGRSPWPSWQQAEQISIVYNG